MISSPLKRTLILHHSEDPFSPELALLPGSLWEEVTGISRSLKRRLVVRVPAVLLSAAGQSLWVGGSLRVPEKACAVHVLQAEMLSCKGIDYVSCLILHLLIFFKCPGLKVYSCLTTAGLRFTTHLLRVVGFTALAACWV